MEHTLPAGNPLATRPVNKLLWTYALPGIASQVITAAHNIVDQIFLGWGVGDLGIAATNIAFPLTSILTGLSALIGMGATANFSILLGKGNKKRAADFLGNAIALMLLCSVSITVCALLFLQPMLYLFGCTDLIFPYAAPYARIICLGLPAGIFATGMAYFIRANGSPTYASITLLSGAVFNMLFDPIFLYVFDMGITGVALATVLGQVLSAVLALLYLMRKFGTVPFNAKRLRLRISVLKGILALGAAMAATHALATVAQVVQMNAFKHYGALSVFGSEAVITASGAVSKLTIVFLSSIIGIAIGSQPIIGFNLGCRQYPRVKRAYLLALCYASAVAGAAWIILQLLPGPLLKIFGSTDPLFYEFGTRYIRIYLAALFLNALQPVTSTFCTAIGKAQLGFWMAVIRQGVLLLPMLLLLPRALGLTGILLAGCLSDAGAAIVVTVIGTREVKKLNRLQQEADEAAASAQDAGGNLKAEQGAAGTETAAKKP